VPPLCGVPVAGVLLLPPLLLQAVSAVTLATAIASTPIALLRNLIGALLFAPCLPAVRAEVMGL
jgi:hypothetical protein